MGRAAASAVHEDLPAVAHREAPRAAFPVAGSPLTRPRERARPWPKRKPRNRQVLSPLVRAERGEVEAEEKDLQHWTYLTWCRLAEPFFDRKSDDSSGGQRR